MGCANHLSRGGASAPQLQPRLKALLDTSSLDWTYAIFWRPTDHDDESSSTLTWGDGFYRGPADPTQEKLKAAESSAAQRRHRRTVLLEVSSLLSKPEYNSDSDSNSFDHLDSDSNSNPDLALDDDFDVTDTEWFFLISMFERVKNGTGLPGRAGVDSDLVWVAEAEELEGSGYDRARKGQGHGLKTMAFFPSVNGGVVELGSTEVIRPADRGLVESVRALFDRKVLP